MLITLIIYLNYSIISKQAIRTFWTISCLSYRLSAYSNHSATTIGALRLSFFWLRLWPVCPCMLLCSGLIVGTFIIIITAYIRHLAAEALRLLDRWRSTPWSSVSALCLPCMDSFHPLSLAGSYLPEVYLNIYSRLRNSCLCGWLTCAWCQLACSS